MTGRTLTYSFLLTLLLVMVFISRADAQAGIAAVYDQNDSMLTITNNSSSIVILRNEGFLSPYYNKADRAPETEGEYKSCYLVYTQGDSIRFHIPKGNVKNGSTIQYHLHKGGKKNEKNFIPVTIKAILVTPNAVVKVQPDEEIHWWVYLAGVFVLLFLFWFIQFVSKNTRRKSKVRPVPSGPSIITVVEEDNSGREEYSVGLDGVRRDPGNYFTVDAGEIYPDTAIREILISRQAVKSMYDHFKKSLESDERTVETGCYFIGRWEYAGQSRDTYNVSLEYIVEPGDDAVFGEYALRFGYYINSEVHKQTRNMSAKTKCEYVHTCWMHSHPGHGLFLSEHDMNVQRGIVYSDAKSRMLALVLDTNTPDWKMAFFTPRRDGTMNNTRIGEVSKTYSLDDLYEWSRSPGIETPDQNIAGTEKYFKLPSGNDDLFPVYFTAKAINNIDDILYTSDKGLVGYFSGSIQTGQRERQSIIIEECKTLESNSGIGCLISDAASAYPEILQRYENIISQCRFFIICRSNNEMIVSIKNKNMKFPQGESSLIKFSMSEMKEWTRRRRN
jgi:proteasome lid subunit RPN8/RPN11